MDFGTVKNSTKNFFLKCVFLQTIMYRLNRDALILCSLITSDKAKSMAQCSFSQQPECTTYRHSGLSVVVVPNQCPCSFNKRLDLLASDWTVPETGANHFTGMKNTVSK